MRQCGDCSLCCKLLGVRELNKPRNVWCSHIQKDKHGCGIHGKEGFPETCGGFKCGWLDRDIMPDSMRPDKVHAFITGLLGTPGIAVYVDPGYPLAHRTGPLSTVLENASRQGVVVIAMIGKRVERLTHSGWVISRQSVAEGETETVVPIMQLTAKDQERSP